MKQTLTRIFQRGFRGVIWSFPENSRAFSGKALLFFGFFLLLNSLNGCQQHSSGGDQQQGDQHKHVPTRDQNGKSGGRAGQNDKTHTGHAGDGVLDHEPIDRQAERLIYTRHARCRMGCRHITEVEIREILQNGEINYHKSEPGSRPDPKYALEGYTKEGQHLRVIFAPSDRGLVVITCIELGIEWQCDCR